MVNDKIQDELARIQEVKIARLVQVRDQQAESLFHIRKQIDIQIQERIIRDFEKKIKDKQIPANDAEFLMLMKKLEQTKESSFSSKTIKPEIYLDNTLYPGRYS